MKYSSKTYSLSNEVVEAIDAARQRDMTPNRYLLHLLALEQAATTDPADMVINEEPQSLRTGEPYPIALSVSSRPERKPLLKPSQK